jgi:hypothetical protein
MVVVACGDGEAETVSTGDRELKVLEVSLPPEIEGLKVQKEDVSKSLEQVRPSYVAEAGLYSLRAPDDLVQATLQINRFVDEERYESSQFRRTIVTQLGGSPPIPTRMGDRTIWRSTGSNQTLALWFDGKSMYLLSVRNDVERPRTLIRQLANLLENTA